MSGDDLPEGWTASGIDELCHRITDGTHFSPKEQNQRGSYKYVTAKNIREWGLDLSGVTYVSEAIHRPIFQRCNPEKDDVLYIKDGATAGIAILNPLQEEFSLLSSVALLKPDRSQLDPSFLKWYLMSPVGRRAMLDQITGSAITRLTLEIIRKSIIPTPPLPEQKRIVAKAEELLACVNVARERLARVPAILKRFRQAVLAAACEGALTEEWRVIAGDTREWRIVALPEIGDARLGKMLDKAKNVGRAKPYLRNTNVRWFGFDLSDVKQLKATDREIDELTVRREDVLICEGGEPGRCAVWRGPTGTHVYQKALHRVRVKNGLLPDWLCYSVKAAADSGRLSGLFTGSTIKHLTGVALDRFELKLPPLEEQREIVRRVEELFKLADAIERRVAAATAQAQKVIQAILAKAFRGELVATEAELARRPGAAA